MMPHAFRRAAFSLFVLSTVGNTTVSARRIPNQVLQAKQQETAQRWLPERLHSGGRGTVKNITFNNPRASEFYVDGANIPLVDFDVGPSWAGLLPISNAIDETRQLFFWFFPPAPQGSLDDLIFWTNGGPGCSSMEGLLQENGLVTRTGQPTPNPYSWTNLSSILYVGQPVGTGFSQGEPSVQNEDDVAAQLVGFFQQFLEVFEELQGKNFYVTGESYAGTYVPYLANYIYENPRALNLTLKGFWISDPSVSWDVVQEQIPAVNFVHKYENVFAFNTSFMEFLDATAERCNYTDYYETYVTYPPTGLLPLPGISIEADEGCDVWDAIFNAALLVNPAFNIYWIFDTWPNLWDVLGFPSTSMPVDVDGAECSDINIFPNGDNSLPPAFTVLPNVIEKSERAVIVHGLADFVLIAEGQNENYDSEYDVEGSTGFPDTHHKYSFIIDGVGSVGSVHSERGLTYFEVELAGHMVPEFSPAAAYQIMQYLMGLRDTPSVIVEDQKVVLAK